MNKLFTLLLVAMCSHSLALGNQCSLSDKQRAEFLKLDYKSFDQTLPDGGWRGFAQRGCELEAAQLIESYQKKHSSKLEKWQTRVLTWHAGQMFASLEMRSQAIAKFKKSYDDNELPDSILSWNLYVDATIEFLKREQKSLLKIRDQMVARKPKDPNLPIVEWFVRCPNALYRAAYSGDCKG